MDPMFRFFAIVKGFALKVERVSFENGVSRNSYVRGTLRSIGDEVEIRRSAAWIKVKCTDVIVEPYRKTSTRLVFKVVGIHE